MKSSLEKTTSLLFFITLISLQLFNSLELSSVAKLSKSPAETIFTKECFYYDLKSDIIITNYVKKINSIVNRILQQDTKIDRENITFQQFWTIFKNGNYGKIACDLADSEDYVRSYFNYYSIKGKMTRNELVQFMGLYYLEGELLIDESHPTLSKFFPNDHEIARRKSCKISLAYWELVNVLLQKIYVKFSWDVTTTIKKKEIFKILIQTHTGKCWLMSGMDCKFFDSIVSKGLGFFNMTYGRNKGLNLSQTKMLFSTFLFKDISVKTCQNKKFDAREIEDISRLLLVEHFNKNK